MVDVISFGGAPHSDEDLPLLEGELSDIRAEACDVAGADWLYHPNDMLGGETPEQMIGAGYLRIVRNCIRTIKYVGSS